MKHRIPAFCLALMLLVRSAAMSVCAEPQSVQTAAEEPPVQTEVYTLAQLVRIRQFLSAQLVPTKEQMTAADFDGDGHITQNDYQLLERRLLELLDTNALRINEICSSNQGAYTAPDGSAPDYIELYNGTHQTLDLGGYGLSDTAGALAKYTFAPGTMLEPGAVYLMPCQIEGESLPFSLDAEGEALILTNPQGSVIDAVSVPAMAADEVCARTTDGGAQWQIMTPTPAQHNAQGTALRLCEAPAFSAPGGFYERDFSLSMQSSRGEIYYTTDGTDPRTSPTAIHYEKPLLLSDRSMQPNQFGNNHAYTLYAAADALTNVDKGNVLRAAAVEDGIWSRPVTQTYFIGLNRSYYQEMTVVSLVTEPEQLFDEQSGIYMVGRDYAARKAQSGQTDLPPWDIENPTNYNQKGRETERAVHVEFFRQGAPVCQADCGVRISGNASRAFAQKSLRLYARQEYGTSRLRYGFFDDVHAADGQLLASFDKLTLRNGGNDCGYTYMRDDLVGQLCAGRSVAIQGSTPCILFIDGEFWGYYSLKERFDEHYLHDHYGVDKENVTIVRNGETEGSDEVVRAYQSFWSWAVSADLSVKENYDKVCAQIDIQSFMDYMAIESYIANADWSNETGMHNWGMWRTNTADGTGYGDGKWRFMLFDTEFSSGLYQDENTAVQADTVSHFSQLRSWENLTLLLRSLLRNEAFRKTFYTNSLKIYDGCFAPERVNALIGQYTQQRRGAVLDTLSRWGVRQETVSFDREVAALNEFYKTRPAYARLYLGLLCRETENTGAFDEWIRLLNQQTQ